MVSVYRVILVAAGQDAKGLRIIPAVVYASGLKDK